MGLFDGYQRGAAAAKADGGENKLTARALEEFARNGFGLMPGAQNREDEFRRGYSETYETIARDAQRNVPVQITSQVTATDFIQPIQGDFTMATHSASSQTGGYSALTLEAQRDLFISLRDYLVSFNTGLSNANQKYKHQMEALEVGLIKNFHSRLKQEHYEPTTAANSNIGDFIVRNSSPDLWKQISHINAQIVQFGGSSEDQKYTNLLDGIVKPDMSIGSTSVDPRSWEGQIELLSNLISFLMRLEVSFSLFQVNYRTKVGLLEGVLMENPYEEFVENHMKPTIQGIQKIREFIQNTTIPFIHSIIATIENRISM